MDAVGEESLLESVAVPPPDCPFTDTEENTGLQENSETKYHLDNESPSSVETTEELNGSKQPTQNGSSAMCFVNTSNDSLMQHSDVLLSTTFADSNCKHLHVEPKNDSDHEKRTEKSPKPAETVPPYCEPSPTNISGLEKGMEQAQEKQNSADPPSDDVESLTLNSNDRNLEQFSEILLDSDHTYSLSDEEFPPGNEPKKETEQITKPPKKVRFADERDEKQRDDLAQTGTHSPPLRPTNISTPEDVARQGRVPVSPSSPRQPIQDITPQFSVNQLIAGIDFSAQYLGSTPIFLSGVASAKSSRMYQAQQAVKLIKDPDSDGRPQSAVNVKISTQCVTISDIATNVDMMEHPLHTISYVADIDNVLVMMAHVLPTSDTTPLSPVTTPVENSMEIISSYTPKMTCHVLDTENARHVAIVIGQAFSAAYKQFLLYNGISEEALEQAEYAHILNAQTVPQVEVDSFNDRNKTRKLTLAKHKGELMGVMVMESGYGSAIPSCVIAHLSKTGAAMKSGLLNIGDHIISINGVNLVGMPKKTCIEQLKKCRYQDVVKMTVCSCPAVVEVTIVRPDLKYQLGFSVQKGMITSLIRGSIAERSGIRVGHRIIEINGTSAVAMNHDDIVHLLSCTVGDLHLRTMPDLMYKLLTGQIVPDYH